MAIKKYIMHNVANARIPLTLGDLKINAEFKNGNIANRVPASLITNDARIQMAIEINKNYFGRLILLEWTHAEPGDIAEKSTPAAVPAQEEVKPLSLEDVKTIDDVKKYLIENHGVAKNISSLATIKAKVEELGIVFPNYSFE